MQKTQTLCIIANSLLFSNLVSVRKMCNFSELKVAVDFLVSIFSITKSWFIHDNKTEECRFCFIPPIEQNDIVTLSLRSQ